MRLMRRMLQDYSAGKEASAMQQTAQTAASEAHEELKKEIAAATSEEADMASRAGGIQQNVPVERKQTAASAAKKNGRSSGERKKSRLPLEALRCRLYSAAQLASRVKKAGDAPDIVKDDITKVTLFDYSDIISGDADDMEE